MEDYWGKTKKLFIDPKGFFSSVKKEKEYLTPLVHVAILWVIMQVLGTIFQAMYHDSPGIVLGLILGTLFSVILAFVWPFISSAVAHVGVLIVGGKKGFFNTFKPTAYSYVIILVYGIIMSIIGALLMSFSSQEAASNVTLIVLAIMLVHTIITEVIGISSYHKISMLRAFIAAVIIPAIFFLVIFFLMSALLVVLLGVLGTPVV